MGLTRTAIQRPLATVMVFLALILLGQQAYTKMKVDRYPSIDFPLVYAQIDWPGASPDNIEQAIIVPAENAISGVSGVQRIDATAQVGTARLTIYFFEGTDLNQATIDTQRALAAIGRQLPTDASQPSVRKADPSAIPVMNVVLTGTIAPEDLYELAYNNVEQQLQSVPGVGAVQLFGGHVPEVEVQVDYDKLVAYGISMAQIASTIDRENVDTPGGNVDRPTQTFQVRAQGEAQAVSDIGSYLVATTPQGPVRLRDIATITMGTQRPTSLVRFTSSDGSSVDGIALTITKQPDANTLDTANNVRAAIQQIQPTLPPGVQIQITNDTSRFINYAVEAVQKDLILAIVITGIVLFLFLHTWRSTLIVLVSIPTCLVSTFLLMYAMGFSLDTISLMAMALMIGILVDDSIVVLENTTRHLGLGENPIVAAIKGRGEIGMAAIAVTLTDVVVYVPISFMQGNVGKMFREFGLTIASATLLSLMVSFTLVPVLASRWLKAHDEEGHERGFAGAWERGFDRLSRCYRSLLGWALPHRPIVVACAVGLLALSIVPLPLNLIGQEFAPNEDDSQFTVTTQMPPGTSLAANSAAMARVEQALLQMPEVANFTTTVGQSGAAGGGSDRDGRIAVQLVDKSQRQRSVFEVMQQVRRVQGSIPGMTVRTSVQAPLVIPGGGNVPINVRILGNNPQALQRIAGQVQQIVANTPGTVDVNNDADVAQPEVRAVLNRDRMADLGVTATAVGNALRTAIGGDTVNTQLQIEGQSGIAITVLANRDLRNDLTALGAIPVPVGLNSGTGTSSSSAASGAPPTVRLDQVAELETDNAPTQIARSARQREVTIQANMVGSSVGDAARTIRAQLAQIPMPPGFRFLWVGQVDQLDQARTALLSALSISILLIYMLLVALYESWLHPLAIMFSLPVALVGAFGGLLLTGNTFNLFSMIGMIMLMGLVAKNAILLVDYTNTLRQRGLDRNSALLEAGRTRLRPIIMTTATMVFSMIPLALKMEEGAESRAPIAVVLLGGLITSTLLTLVLVPVMYTYLDDLGRVPALARARVPGWLRLRGVGSLVRGDVGEGYGAAARQPEPSDGPSPRGRE